jgi:hypothetical protein
MTNNVEIKIELDSINELLEFALKYEQTLKDKVFLDTPEAETLADIRYSLDNLQLVVNKIKSATSISPLFWELYKGMLKVSSEDLLTSLKNHYNPKLN